MSNISKEDIRCVLSEVFSSVEIPVDCGPLKMGDLEPWDSLGNFNLLLAIEDRFNVRFTFDEIAEIKSVSQIIKALEDK